MHSQAPTVCLVHSNSPQISPWLNFCQAVLIGTKSEEGSAVLTLGTSPSGIQAPSMLGYHFLLPWRVKVLF